MANHTITHARLPVMNEANIVYELEQSRRRCSNSSDRRASSQSKLFRN
jgi:hypothetical protein